MYMAPCGPAGVLYDFIVDPASRPFAHAGFRRTMIEMTRALDDRAS